MNAPFPSPRPSQTALRLAWLLLLIPCLAPPTARAARPNPDSPQSVQFNRDVRPILAQHCFKCHGMDEHGRKGDLRLDLREAALGKGKSGETAIVPGKPDQSEIIHRILSEDPEEIMPPPSTKTVLPANAKAILKAWIEQGADYQPHWAYSAPKRPTPPTLAPHPIDALIRERLNQEGLTPSPEADKLTLIRRLSLDLIGLPPTPAEADAFLNDPAPDAYDRLVDSLLASPRYGERWARRWLDLARYADTNGFEKDRPRSIWPYRDWVVRALNADMPFDQFSIRQLAGDLLPNPTPEDLIATGFHRNTMLNEEGGIDPLEYRFYAMVDRVSVTGTTWMGLTLNCTQCHTHKYDPLLHTDYYRLMALLNNASEPTYSIPSPEVAAQQKAHEERLAKLEADLPNRFPGGPEAIAARIPEWISKQKLSVSHWTVLKPESIQTNLPHLETQPDGFLLGSGDITKSDTYTLRFRQPLQKVRALRIEVASHPTLPNGGPGLTYYEGPIGGFFLSELKASQGERPVAFLDASATNDAEEDRINDATAAKPKPQKDAPKKKKNSVAAAIDGEMSSGWQVLGGNAVSHTAIFRFSEPVDLTQGLELTMLFEKHFACSLGHFRISVTTGEQATATGHPAEVEELLASNAPDPKDPRLVRRFLQTAPELEAATREITAARQNPPRGQTTLILQERPANQLRPTHRYHRGEYLQPREEVTPAVPAFLPPLPKDAPQNRLTFARWLFSKENPLTARVTANRHWQAFFGHGLVTSLEDFGYQSDPPSHPELLDWLATELVRLNWSIKQFHRLIVTSETYKQSSRVPAASNAKDPKNIWLSRGSRFRLDAEIIRDSALKAAGLLSEKMGGPGVYPPQPASVTSEGTYGKIEWKTSEGEDRYRRSLYTFTKRTAPFAMATTFDAPTGEACLAKRDVSNSPLQALTLLNDSMFLEAANALAKQVLAEAPSEEARLHSLFRRCTARSASPEEIALMRQFLEHQRSINLTPEALWTSVARAVLNLDEFITHP
jgi:hypothetical protein